MLRRIFTFAALAALTAFTALAADIDGKWTAEVQGRGGPQTQTLTLMSDGNKLTGNLDAGRGGPVNISNGTVMGNDVEFDVVREFQGNSVTLHYKGTLSGSDLKIMVTGGRNPQDITFKKAS